MKRHSAAPLRPVFACTLILQGVGLILAALLCHTINVPTLRLRIETPLILGAGGALLVLGLGALAARRLSPAWSMAAVFATLPVTVAFALGYQPVRPGDFTLLLGARLWQSATEWTDMNTTADPVAGHKGKPNSTARQSNRDFNVTYRTDADGWRVMPAPTPDPSAAPGAPPTVWFLGCSFTFGAGVEDSETYAYQLAAHAWPHARVRNYSYSGWGTTNAYLVLKDKLAQKEKPDVVVYGLISHHMRRNYLRQSWFSVNGSDKPIPHFELEQGRLRWDGFISRSAAILPDSPELDRKELALTVALIGAMAEMSRQRGVPFVVLVLHSDQPALVDAVRATPNLSVLDVSQLSTAFHPHDGHPTALWHQAVAHAIAADPLLARVSVKAALHAPAAIADPPMRLWHMSRSSDVPATSRATIVYPAAAGAPLGAQFSGTPVDDPWKLYLHRFGFDIVAGRRYVYTMRVRASAPRTLHYLVSSGGAPWGNLGLEKQLALGTDWHNVREEFTATGSDSNAQIMLLLGGATAAVEVDGEPQLRALTGAPAETPLDPAEREHGAAVDVHQLVKGHRQQRETAAVTAAKQRKQTVVGADGGAAEQRSAQ